MSSGGTDFRMAPRVSLSVLRLVCERESMVGVVVNQCGESGMVRAATGERKIVAYGVMATPGRRCARHHYRCQENAAEVSCQVASNSVWTISHQGSIVK